MTIIKKHSCGNAMESIVCCQCGKSSADSKCSRCGEASYCNRECQVGHWRTHKKSCGSAMKRGIVLSRPQKFEGFTQLASNRRGVYADRGYQRPCNVVANELFWVKLQRPVLADGIGHLLLYDKRRECQFSIEPNDNGFSELKERIMAQKDYLVSKAHFQAMFNEQDEMIIYPRTSILHSW